MPCPCMMCFDLLSLPRPQATPYMMMSPNSLLFSFAKFIELKVYCDSYRARPEGGGVAVGAANLCGHSLHKDYVHCFIYRNKLATFR